MKFQIECCTEKSRQECLICKQIFKINEARLIVCNDGGDRYGDVCHQCIAKGGNWVQFQLQEFSNKLLATKTEVGV